MASITIYNLPDETSDTFALTQEAYDRQVAAGMITPDGRLEAAAFQATRVREVSSQLDQTQVLMGLHLKTSIAYIPTLPTYAVQRSTSPLEAPSLGTVAKRESDKQKVIDAVEEVSGNDKIRGLKVAAVIDQTIEDNNEIAFVRGRMGEVMAV